jgi:hypothetical protein
VESYGFHALETLQCMVERRRGGETGVAAVQCVEGDAVWDAGGHGLWSRELAEAACATIEVKPDGPMEAHCPDPAIFLIEYRDGLRAAVLMLNGYVRHFAYAGRTPPPAPPLQGEGGLSPGAVLPSPRRGGAGGGVAATEFYLQGGYPHGHFNYLALNIEELVLNGTPPYPVERTLLTTGILDALMTSRAHGHARIETPHLEIAYRSYETPPWRATAPRPAGANLAVWPPK